MPHLRVSLAFANAADYKVEETAGAVSAQLYGNAAFPTPPVANAALDAAHTDFTKAIATAQQGGPADTADKNNKREVLVGLLRQLAGYVQSNHHDDLAVLLSSGFAAVSTTRTPAALIVPVLRDILNGGSGLLILRVKAMRNVLMFRVRFAAIGADGAHGPWQDGGLHSNSRKMLIAGLTPGTTYVIQVAAAMSGNRQSDWSDPVSHMSL